MKKIVVIGPESTGKSMLCKKLAEHYSTAWAREYAREYLLTNGTGYTYDNLLDIAKGQIGLEEKMIVEWKEANINQEITREIKRSTSLTASEPATAVNHTPLFIDTDMYVMKVWCEFVFEKCHHWILNRIVERKYDLYLLCNIDLPWVKDELREYPDLLTREKLYHHYKDIMVNQQVPWIDISGDYEERLQKAVAAVDAII